MVDDKLTLLTEEALEPEKVTAERAAASFAEAEKMPNRTEAENAKRETALSRARALARTARNQDVN
jgi:formiminotetrahydrofolate cyclodeaminase